MPHLAMASRWPRVCGRLHVDRLPRRPLRPRASPNGAQLPFGAGSLFAPTPSHCSARTPAETDLSAAR
jgi:hypothetical protein